MRFSRHSHHAAISERSFRLGRICLRRIVSLAWILLGGLVGVGWSQPSDPGGSVVVDNAQIIQPSDLSEIRGALTELERTTGIEGAILTVNSISEYGTGDASIESFARTMFDKWKIGRLPENNGFLIVVSRTDRIARIELGGGYVHRLDGSMQKTMDKTMVPAFAAGEYSRGIKEGTLSVIKKVNPTVPWFKLKKWGLIIVGVVGVACLLLTMGVDFLADLGVTFLLLGGFYALDSSRDGLGYACFAVAFVVVVWMLLARGRLFFFSGFSGDSPSGGGGGATGSW